MVLTEFFSVILGGPTVVNAPKPGNLFIWVMTEAAKLICFFRERLSAGFFQ